MHECYNSVRGRTRSYIRTGIRCCRRCYYRDYFSTFYLLWLKSKKDQHYPRSPTSSPLLRAMCTRPQKGESAQHPQSEVNIATATSRSGRSELTWLRYIPEDQEDGSSMLCTLCGKHNETSKRMVWLSIPCKLLRKDKVREHERSQCHIDAVKAEALAVAARRSNGIRACMEDQVSPQRQAVRGAFKCLYWLAKQETAHHTKFSSLLELGKSLGCSYLNEL